MRLSYSGAPCSILPMDQSRPAPPARSLWTPGKQRIFLHALIATGSVTAAARAAGMSRSAAQRLRTRLAGTPFDRLWSQALALHARSLANPFAGDAANTRS